MTTAAERFWAMADRRQNDECWPWLGYRSADGYGRFNTDRRKPENAHRVAYRLLVGPIPSGLTLDHLCRNRACVNPAHLEPVTNRENVLRGTSEVADRARRTHCKRGHPLSGDNLRIDSRGFRRCNACKLLWYHEHKDLAERRHLDALARQPRPDALAAAAPAGEDRR